MHPNINEKRTFYWIDYETWGVNPATDKPCQFAGIRTDEEPNIIGEPLVIYCQPPNDYLPSPEACLVTGITPQLATSKGLLSNLGNFCAVVSFENNTAITNNAITNTFFFILLYLFN